MRILLIEDNPSLASSIAIGLKNNDFTVDSFMTAGDSEAALETVDYDAVILDLCLPDGDGLDLLRTSRNRGNSVPVLILTGCDSVEERIKGLDCGADDYLLKPFDMDELMARIRALLRRPGGILGITLTSGNISFDTTSREVCIKNKPISISRRELEVLELLMRRRGRVVPKNVLEEKIYGFGEETASNSVEALISRLRKRLTKVGASTEIHTLRGVGYLLAGDDA